MVRRVRKLDGAPTAFNDKQNLGGLTDYLKSAGNSRLLLVPLIAGEEIIGFIDARDKGRKRPFERTDVANAKKIAHAMVEFAKRAGFVFSDDDFEEYPDAAPIERQPAELGPPRAPMLDESGLENVHDAALDAVLDHQVVAVAVTLVTGGEAATLVNIREGSADFDRDALIRHQSSALIEAGAAAPDHGSWQIDVRRIPTTVDPAPSPMIASAVLLENGDISSLTGSIISGGGANAGGLSP